MSSPESQEIWTRSDVYHNSFLIPKDEVLEKIVDNSKTNGLRDISVSAAQGKFLNLIALSIGAKKILEVGTLGG
jgi:predicted O-methyltransferase YrrM